MKVPLTYKQENWKSVLQKEPVPGAEHQGLCQVTASLLETQISCFTMCSPQMVKTACFHGMRKLRSDITCSMVCSCAATCVLPAPVTAPCGPAQWKLVSSNNSQKVENVWPKKQISLIGTVLTISHNHGHVHIYMYPCVFHEQSPRMVALVERLCRFDQCKC